MSEVVCAKVRLKPGMLPRVREWAAHMHQHAEAALATLVAEGVSVETVFLDSSADGDFLVYLMRADSVDQATRVAAGSVSEIDRYHRDFKREAWAEVRELELLVDLPQADKP